MSEEISSAAHIHLLREELKAAQERAAKAELERDVARADAATFRASVRIAATLLFSMEQMQLESRVRISVHETLSALTSALVSGADRALLAELEAARALIDHDRQRPNGRAWFDWIERKETLIAAYDAAREARGG